jgi:hypothetical protein
MPRVLGIASRVPSAQKTAEDSLDPESKVAMANIEMGTVLLDTFTRVHPSRSIAKPGRTSFFPRLP